MTHLNPTVSYLFLGSGNFSSPLSFAWQHSEFSREKGLANGIDLEPDPERPDYDPKNNPAARVLVGITLTATEYRTREQALERYIALSKRDKTWGNENNAYTRYFENIHDIQNLGAKLIEGFDATKYPTGFGKFDHIIFENPHTEDYGDASDTSSVKNLTALQSNRALVENAMKQASVHLNAGGTFKLHISGWPFQSRSAKGGGMEWEKGMELDTDGGARRLAASGGMKFVQRENLGLSWIERNNGERFQAETTRLVFTL